MGSPTKIGHSHKVPRIANREPDYDNLELEEPLIIEDNQFSKEAFTDRGRLVDLIHFLAERTFTALKKDNRANKRYARVMSITNKFSHPDSPNKRMRMRETFKIHLPPRHICWNDVKLEDIELMMLDRVANIREEYRWYKVNVRLGFFLSEEVRSQAEELDEKYRREDEEYSKYFGPDSLDQMTERNMPALPPSMMMPKNPIQSPNVQPSTLPSVPTQSDNFIKRRPKKRAQSSVVEDDDDDEIEIILEKKAVVPRPVAHRDGPSVAHRVPPLARNPTSIAPRATQPLRPLVAARYLIRPINPRPPLPIIRHSTPTVLSIQQARERYFASLNRR